MRSQRVERQDGIECLPPAPEVGFVVGDRLEIKSELKGAKAGRHADKFAIIFAAGALAILYDLLPWTKEEYLSAILTCFRASATTLSDNSAALLKDGLQRLDRNLADSARIAPWPQDKNAPPPATIEGWQKDGRAGRTYFVLASAFRQWFTSPEQTHLVESHLMATGRIRADAYGNFTRQKRIPGMAERPRLYVIKQEGA